MTPAQEIRFAARSARKAPVFTLTVLATLALVIGVNTAIFTVVDGALLRALPYPSPERLVEVATVIETPRGRTTRTGQDGRVWEGLRENVRSLDLGVWSTGATRVNFVHDANVRLVQLQRVGSGFFRVLGVAPAIGREFTFEEDGPSGASVVVLSHGLWRSVFQEDPDAIGRAVFLRGEPHTVVGVMPPGFRSTAPADLWTPLRASTFGEGAGTNYAILGRVHEGVRTEKAAAEIVAMSDALFRDLPLPPDVRARLGLIPLQEGLGMGLRTPLLTLCGGVLAVLFIGCVNVATMFLARGAARTREIGTRLALGALPRSILRELWIESMTYALAGGILGFVVAQAVLASVRRIGEASFPFLAEVSLDLRVVCATAVLSLLACLLFGVVPALRAGRVDLRVSIGGGQRIAGASTSRPLQWLVLGQLALVVPLLIAATLLGRSFAHLWRLSPGFDPSNLVAASVSLNDARYQSAIAVDRVARRGVAELSAIPGVEAAAMALAVPYEPWLNMPFGIEGADDEPRVTSLNYVTPDYFRALLVPVSRGRAFTDSDDREAPRVVVVTESFVNRYLRDRAALGTRIRLAEETWEVVGVVRDVQQQPRWGTAAPLSERLPTAYLPLAQTGDSFLRLVHTWFSPSFVVRTASPDMVAALEETTKRLDPLLPIAGFRSLAEIKVGSLALERFLAALVAAFAALATVLAGVGIYGLVATTVEQRRRELSIRMALGSTALEALENAMRPAVRLALIGVASGLGLALVSSRFMRSLVWGVASTDAATFAGVALGAIVLAAAASSIPASRVLRMDPASALREE
jgi:predicted permease